tara:strand:+ start:8750 stop:10078 length:1329 start_codon:yes stop_codon:yes gene_type:complete
MIRTPAQLAVLNSKYDAQNQEKQRWIEERQRAYNYYKGRTDVYTRGYFAEMFANKLPIANVNITKRIIDRVSLVYMKPPQREYTNPEIMDVLIDKDHKLQRAERLTNLLEVVLIHPCWRDDHIEYDIIRDFEPIFGENPLVPIGITYPLQVRSTVFDDTAELWAYWDDEHHYTYDRNGKIYTEDDNPEMINPYGVLPFVECFRDGKPESAYLDTDACPDLIATNCLINVAETNKAANVMFQSFGYIYAQGSYIDSEKLKVGQDQILNLGADGSLGMVSPPNSIPALTESIKESYKMLAQNYHLQVSFVEGTTAESGVALKLRNQELTDERISDVIRWKEIEINLFELEKLIIAVEMGKDAGGLEHCDFDETTEVLSDQEQRERWEWELSHGLIDVVDILMQKDPDQFPERKDAEAYLEERKQVKETEEGEGNELLKALTEPV